MDTFVGHFVGALVEKLWKARNREFNFRGHSWGHPDEVMATVMGALWAVLVGSYFAFACSGMVLPWDSRKIPWHPFAESSRVRLRPKWPIGSQRRAVARPSSLLQKFSTDSCYFPAHLTCSSDSRVTHTEGSFNYQGDSTRGVRHALHLSWKGWSHPHPSQICQLLLFKIEEKMPENQM